MPPIDDAIIAFDRLLRTVAGPARATRSNPAEAVAEAPLEDAERAHAAALMRVNHCGEVCAQALYQGQSLASENAQLKRALEQAACEEEDHLAWTEARIAELGGRTSLLNEELEINGLEAYTAIVRGDRSPYGTSDNVRYVIIAYNNLMWVMRGARRADDPVPQADVLFVSAAKTFRQLRSNEFRLAEPYRLRIVPAPAGMSIEQIAAKSPLPKYSLEQHKLINGLYPDKQPRAGDPVKFVQ